MTHNRHPIETRIIKRQFKRSLIFNLKKMNKPLFYKCLPARAIALTLLLMAITSIPVLAQNKTVTGKVQADDGSVVAGVSITVKGTTKGTTTGADGSFTIQAPATGTLVFSMVGYLTQEASVSAGSFNIKLER